MGITINKELDGTYTTTGTPDPQPKAPPPTVSKELTQDDLAALSQALAVMQKILTQ